MEDWERARAWVPVKVEGKWIWFGRYERRKVWHRNPLITHYHWERRIAVIPGLE